MNFSDDPPAANTIGVRSMQEIQPILNCCCGVDVHKDMIEACIISGTDDTIIFRKQENMVSGLTTAAGLWVTAAIGLACGGGMYVLSTASTLLVLFGLEAFNYFLRKFDKHRKE